MMNDENDHDYFQCKLLRSSPGAWLVKLNHNGAEHWIPKKVCDLKMHNDAAVLEVEAWFAKKEGMHE